MNKTVVDILYEEYSELTQYFLSNQELSYKISIEANFKKNLILATASYFEHLIITSLMDYTTKVTNNNEILIEFFKNKAVNRQFHTFFNWNDSNANSFFGLFGSAFLKNMKEKVQQDVKLSEGIKAFLEIGNERNRIVHQNYASYTVDKTTNEIYESYKLARYFTDNITEYLNQKK
ncbi:MAG: HEPN domain-containing protein [Bacteroidia bacterium]